MPLVSRHRRQSPPLVLINNPFAIVDALALCQGVVNPAWLPRTNYVQGFAAAIDDCINRASRGKDDVPPRVEAQRRGTS